MAQFDAKPQAAPVGSYVGLSQGIRADRDTALGQLFGNLAEIGSAGVQAADQAVIKQMEDEAFSLVEETREDFGVVSATDASYSSSEALGGGLPESVQNEVQHLNDLQGAYEAGGLRASHYWARLNAATRQLRARYPGYREEIDQYISGLVGSRPANALQSALFSEWSAAAAEAGQGSDNFQNLIRQVSNDQSIGGLPTDWFSREANGNPYSYTELLHYQSTRKRNLYEIETKRTEMAIAADVQGLNEETALKNFEFEAGSFIRQVIEDTTHQIGGNAAEISDRLRQAQRDAAQGNPWPQQEIAGLQAAMSELLAMAETHINETFVAQWDDDPSHAYNQFLDTQTRNEAIQRALEPIRLIGVGLSTESLSLVDVVQTYNAAMTTDAGSFLLREYDFIPMLSALAEVATPEVADIYLGYVPRLQTDMASSFMNHQHTLAGLGRGNIYTALNAVENNPELAEAAKPLVDRWTEVVEGWTRGDGLTPDMMVNNIDYMFTEDAQKVFSTLDDSSKFEYFADVTSPRVTEAMKGMKNEGYEDAWQKYQQWTANAFLILFRDKITGLNTVNAAGGQISWDDSANGFVMQAQARVIGSPFSTPDVALRTELSELNSAIRNIAPILVENGGDVAQEMIRMFEQAGYDPNQERPQTNALQMLWDALTFVIAPGGE